MAITDHCVNNVSLYFTNDQQKLCSNILVSHTARVAHTHTHTHTRTGTHTHACLCACLPFIYVLCKENKKKKTKTFYQISLESVLVVMVKTIITTNITEVMISRRDVCVNPYNWPI